MRRSLSRVLVCAVLLISAACEAGPRHVAEPPTVPMVDRAVGDYVLVEGRIPSHILDLEVSRLIGTDGGSLHLAGNSIEVPAGAVSQPTLFTMTLLTDGYVEVELSAVLTGLLGEVVDAGEDGFGDEKVSLTLTYAWATNVDDPQDLTILRLHPDGSYDTLETTVDEATKTVTAELDHFSRFCMAST